MISLKVSTIVTDINQIGDLALIDTADILRRVCDRNHGFLARYVGDEFAVILERKSDTEIKNIVQEIKNSIKEFNSKNSRQYTLAVSIGYVKFESEEEMSIDKLIENADASMYEMKKRAVS